MKKLIFFSVLSAITLLGCDESNPGNDQPGNHEQPTNNGNNNQPGNNNDQLGNNNDQLGNNNDQPGNNNNDQLGYFEERVQIIPRFQLMTTEAGTTDTFKVQLNAEPTSEVRIKLEGTPATEGSLDIEELVFTPENWQTPQVVTVTGVDDQTNDGNQIFTVNFSISSSDTDFEAFEIKPLLITNVETTEGQDKGEVNTVRFVEEGLVTDEFGSNAYVVLALTNRPAHPVKINFVSTDSTEAVPERTNVIIEPDNWNDLHEAIIVGVDDNEKDGRQPFDIQLRVSSLDQSFHGKKPINFDTDELTDVIHGFTEDNDGEPLNELIVTPVSGASAKTRALEYTAEVSEDGSCTKYAVSLKNPPKNNTTVFTHALVTDPTEGRIDNSVRAFNADNYKVPQTFEICGVNDDEMDGDVLFGVKFVTFSDDLACNDLESETLILLNRDNDESLNETFEGAVLISKKYSCLYTNETGKTASFGVRLNQQPSADVAVTVKSADPTEGTLFNGLSGFDDEITLHFTPLNWNQNQEVTVHPRGDGQTDGDIHYNIEFTTSSKDTRFNDLYVHPVYIKNFDEDGDNNSGSSYEAYPSNNNELFIFGSNVSENTLNVIGDDHIAIRLRLGKEIEQSIPIYIRTNNSDKALVSNSFHIDPNLNDASFKESAKHTFTSATWNNPLNYYVMINKDNTLSDGDTFSVTFYVDPKIDDPVYKTTLSKTFQFIYRKDGMYTPIEAGNTNFTITEPENTAKVVFSPDACNTTGLVRKGGENQVYSVHLAQQPKNNVKITFDIPDKDENLIKFKNGKYTLTFKPSNYNVDQTLELVAGDIGAGESAATTLSYSMESADERFNGIDEFGCSTYIDIKGENAKPETTQTVKTAKLRIMAANATSGEDQLYEKHGMNMFYAMDPDIIIIQEFAPSYKTVIKNLEDHFHTTYAYHKGSGRIGNGIIVKGDLKIKEIFTQPSVVPNITDRGYDAAIVDIPGDKDLLVVSLHLYTQQYTTQLSQIDEYPAVANFIQSILNTGDYYVAVGGDLNSTTNYYVNTYWNTLLATDARYPVDQNGNFKTNAARKKHYDWLLVDKDFQQFSVATQIGDKSYPNGYVLDSRVQTPLSDIAPVQYEDSAAVNMQHMPVIRDFLIEY